MKNAYLFLAIALCGIIFSSCKKNDSDNGGRSQLNYQIVVTNTTSGLAQKTTASANIVWSSGFANPRRVKFEAEQDHTKIELTSTDNTQIDLMSSVAMTFGNFTIPPGTYNEIELKINLEKDGSNPSLELNGTFTNNSTIYPVLLQVTEPLEIKTEQEDVVITDNTSFTAVTTLDLSEFTEGITESMLLNAQLTNGMIVISKNSNKNMYYTIVHNISNRRHHCEFHHHH